MFSDYKALIINTYNKRMIEGTLSINLQNPTSAKLRNECLEILKERFSQKNDYQILKAFFGHHDNINEYGQYISSVDLDKFKPLVNFLREKTIVTDDKNIELLSWLLDIKPRPHNFNYDYKQELGVEVVNDVSVESEYEHSIIKGAFKIDEQKKVSAIIESLNKGEKNREKGKNNLVKSKTSKYILISVLGLSILGLSFLFLKDRVWNEKNCMYWNNDHYVNVDCDKQNGYKQAFILDKSKLENFRKITKLDTLTEACIGKIWYSKINNEVEFFTFPGMHPTHPEKSLKLVTHHIFETYIFKSKK